MTFHDFQDLCASGNLMGDCLQMRKPPRYITSHRRQLRLAIHPRVGAMNTSKKQKQNK